MTFTPLMEDLLRALESGEYEQGNKQLTQGEEGSLKHCCLGVACERFIAAGGQLIRAPYEAAFWETGFQYVPEESEEYLDQDGSVAYAPSPVWRALGLRDDKGSINCDHISPKDPLVYRVLKVYPCSLADLNDNGFTFEEIAGFIRRNPEAVLAPEEDQA